MKKIVRTNPARVYKTCRVCGKLVTVRKGREGEQLWSHKGPCGLVCDGGAKYDGPSGSYHGASCDCKEGK